MDHAMLYVLADEKNSPLLVKYDSSASYLPVFETELSAREAMVNLKKGASSSVCNPTANYQCKPFEWCLFKQWQENSNRSGYMLFVYPMSPRDYGGSA